MKRQRGVALITVLLVVALASLVTAGLVLRQQLSIRSSTNQLLARQAWHFALGGEAGMPLASDSERRNLKGTNPSTSFAVVTLPLGTWAAHFPPVSP